MDVHILRGISIFRLKVSKSNKKKLNLISQFSLHFFLEFSESTEIVQIVDIMISHFQRFPHWYDIDVIVENSTLDLRIENILEDEALGWENWHLDFKNRPDDVVNAIGLAIHSLLLVDNKNNGLKKIFVR